MAVTYFKRYKMSIDLRSVDFDLSREESDYSFVRYRSDLIASHALAKYLAFREELDSHVFPCLGNHDGCLKLMKEISCRKGFVPQATWLLVHHNRSSDAQPCGTVQGIRSDEVTGAIQNLGIVKPHRGKGLGIELLKRSLAGFASVGIETVSLEVTAKNCSAIWLYKKMGFTITELVFKSADLKYA